MGNDSCHVMCTTAEGYVPISQITVMESDTTTFWWCRQKYLRLTQLNFSFFIGNDRSYPSDTFEPKSESKQHKHSQQQLLQHYKFVRYILITHVFFKSFCHKLYTLFFKHPCLVQVDVCAKMLIVE